MRFKIGGVLRIIYRIKGWWIVCYKGKFRRILLWGWWFGIFIGGRWKYVFVRGGVL